MTNRPTERSARTAGYAAWIWVIVFIAIHVYCYLGGTMGHPHPLSAITLNAFSLTVMVLFTAGAIVPLASATDWGQAIPHWMLLAALWFGCAILVLRGFTGIIDELLRVTDRPHRHDMTGGHWLGESVGARPVGRPGDRCVLRVRRSPVRARRVGVP